MTVGEILAIVERKYTAGHISRLGHQHRYVAGQGINTTPFVLSVSMHDLCEPPLWIVQ